MYKHLYSIFLFFSTLPVVLLSQNIPVIQIDRPSQSESPNLIEKNFCQFETGISTSYLDQSFRSIYCPSTLSRYGLNTKTEFRLISEYYSDHENKKSGLLPLSIGFKTALFEQKGFIPKTSISGYITTKNLGSKIFRTNEITPSFKLIMLHNLNKNLSLVYNLGLRWQELMAPPLYFYTFCLGVNLSKKISGFAENYCMKSINDNVLYGFDGGFTYLMNENFIMDLSSGIELSQNSIINYFTIGFSYRMNPLKKPNKKLGSPKLQPNKFEI